jgi:hypothetical protein
VNLRLTAVAVLCILGLAARDARANDPTKEQCASANEAAQALRHDGKLRAARAQLLICIAKGCPQVVREDCAERLNDLEAAIPTIVFTAKGAGNVDVSTVKVTVDGAPLADRLDGSALAVDPGPHTFELTADGYATVSTTLVVGEGVKRRQELISFGPARQPPRSSPTPSTERPPAESRSGAGQRTFAYVLGGAGLVGIGLGAYFGLHASSTYSDATSHCPTTSSCDAAGVAGGRDAHTQATISTIGFVAGAAMLAGGVVLLVTAPKRRGVSVQPTAGIGSAGIRVGGAW